MAIGKREVNPSKTIRIDEQLLEHDPYLTSYLKLKASFSDLYTPSS